MAIIKLNREKPNSDIDNCLDLDKSNSTDVHLLVVSNAGGSLEKSLQALYSIQLLQSANLETRSLSSGRMQKAWTFSCAHRLFIARKTVIFVMSDIICYFVIGT